MATPGKAQAIQELKERFDRATTVIMTEYRGLKAQEMLKLRRTLRQSGLEYKVVKNTLLRRAATGTYAEQAAHEVTGPVGVAFGYDDAAAAVKVLSERAGELEKLNIKWGCIDQAYFGAADIDTIAKLPDRHTMLSRVVATIHSPVTNLVFTLQSIPQRLVGTLQAYADKRMEDGGTRIEDEDRESQQLNPAIPDPQSEIA